MWPNNNTKVLETSATEIVSLDRDRLTQLWNISHTGIEAKDDPSENF